LNYGNAPSQGAATRHLGTIKAAGAGLILMLSMLLSAAAIAQQAAQTGFDPRQTEKYFEDLQSRERAQPARPGLRMPVLPRPMSTGDAKPLFVLRGVTITGALAISPDQLSASYQP